MNKQIDITKVVLTTDRLTLRPWSKSDWNDFYEYASVDGVGQMAGWNPHRNVEKSKMILSQFIKGKHVFALEHHGRIIGSLGIEAGIQISHEVASDGASELLQDLVNGLDEASYQQYLCYHFYICQKPEFLGMSNHLLFVGSKNTLKPRSFELPQFMRTAQTGGVHPFLGEGADSPTLDESYQ